jgi:ATP-dependent Clp protease ATP-binding subunit ClpA
LDLYAINLNDKAKQSKLDPLIGREDLQKTRVQLLLALQRREPNVEYLSTLFLVQIETVVNHPDSWF